MATETTKPRVGPVQTEDDVTRCHHCAVEAFARQAGDGIWCAFNPGWDTPDGEARGAARLATRWRASQAEGPGARDAQGRPHTIILKAVLPAAAEGGPGVVAGIAIWTQASFVAGHGVAPAEDLGAVVDLEALYPGDPAEQRYLRQLDAALHRWRVEVLREKAAAAGPGLGPPATAAFVLDLCAVDPAYQRRGLARALVQWGLDEAERRGGIECITEASSMGRHVYLQMGFKQEGGEMEYVVDEFKDRTLPSNVFLRTGPPGQ
ncbi:hypothetical protein RB595_008357 [Gaeumannomyces hyphopodioides]